MVATLTEAFADTYSNTDNNINIENISQNSNVIRVSDITSISNTEIINKIKTSPELFKQVIEHFGLTKNQTNSIFKKIKKILLNPNELVKLITFCILIYLIFDLLKN